MLASFVVVSASGDETEYNIEKHTELGYMTGYSTREKISLSENWTGGSIEGKDADYGDVIVLKSSKTDESQQQLGYIDIEEYDAQKYSLSFDIKPIRDTREIRFYFRNSDAKDVAHIVLMNGKGVISKSGSYVGSGFTGDDDNAKSFTYTTGEWINFEMVADVTGQTVEWYVNGAHAVSAKTSATGVIRRIIPFYGTSADVTDYGYIDNFRLSAITETKAKRDTASTVSYRKFDDGLEPNKGLMQAGSPFTAYNTNDEAHPTVAYMNKTGTGEGGNIFILGRDEKGDVVSTGGTYQVPSDKDYVISFDMKVISGEFAMFLYTTDTATNNQQIMFMTYVDEQKLGLRKTAQRGWEPVANLQGGTNSSYNWLPYSKDEWHTIDLRVKKATREIDLYIDGVYAATSTIAEAVTCTDIRTLKFYVSSSAEAQLDNFRLSMPSDGSFYAEAKASGDKIAVTFTEKPKYFNPKAVVVTDENGKVIPAEVSNLSGHTFVVKPSVKNDTYKIVLSDRLISSVTGCSLAGNTAEAHFKGVFVKVNQLRNGDTALAPDGIGDIPVGTKVSFATEFLNTTGDEAPVERLILLGTYNEDGRLIDCDYAIVEVGNGTVVATEDQIPSVAITADTARVVGYVWGEEYIPVVEYVEAVKVNE